jgi:cysteine desulfurase NifS/selenium donor protein
LTQQIKDDTMDHIYLDYNATTPISPDVKAAMLPFLDEKFGNPSSTHWYGVQTKLALEKARAQIADMLGCATDEIIFTSGGSEANNLAIKGFAFANQHKGKHIITSVIEHPAVLQVCQYLEQHGFSITYLQVDEFGLVDISDFEKAIRPDTILASIMHANNEVGTIQPIAELSQIARKHNIVFHTDAAQSVGKIPVRVDELGVDVLSIAGHKFYAPKGIGALYSRHGIELEKQIHGADHEFDRRAGTENILEIVGLGRACESVQQNLTNNQTKLAERANQLLTGLKKLDGVQLNGHPKNRLPNTVSLSFYKLEANTILDELDTIAASAGAACHSSDITVSHVLEAMNVPTEWAMGTIRFSVGLQTTTAEIDQAIERVSTVIQNLRGEQDHVILSRDTIKLTHFTHGLGCACKLRPQILEDVLQSLPKPNDANILVGTESADDAAVYKIDDHTAIVQTVDFFTPIVDDPYHFGAIAAANSLSDVYAMGAEPLFALNIVGFPSNRLPIHVLDAMLRGALDKATEAGIAIVGGHTVDDTEPKYGLAVTGKVNPNNVWKNVGAQPDDMLVLTKPLGLGIITTAMKRGMATKTVEQDAIAIMSTLNAAAAAVAQHFDIHACTDVTGFGLLGHLSEMTRGSHVDAELFLHQIPLIDGAADLANAGAIPGGSLDNLDYVTDWVTFDTSISRTQKIILADAQTSGGLLFAVRPEQADKFLSALQQKCDTSIAIIGKITAQGSGRIHVTGKRP